jgi:hypothetical protein
VLTQQLRILVTYEMHISLSLSEELPNSRKRTVDFMRAKLSSLSPTIPLSTLSLVLPLYDDYLHTVQDYQPVLQLPLSPRLLLLLLLHWPLPHPTPQPSQQQDYQWLFQLQHSLSLPTLPLLLLPFALNSREKVPPKLLPW